MDVESLMWKVGWVVDMVSVDGVFMVEGVVAVYPYVCDIGRFIATNCPYNGECIHCEFSGCLHYTVVLDREDDEVVNMILRDATELWVIVYIRVVDDENEVLEK